MPNPFKETNLFEPMNRSNLIYGRIMRSKFPTGTNPNPYEVDPLPVAELEMEDPLSAEYRYYDEPLVLALALCAMWILKERQFSSSLRIDAGALQQQHQQLECEMSHSIIHHCNTFTRYRVHRMPMDTPPPDGVVSGVPLFHRRRRTVATRALSLSHSYEEWTIFHLGWMDQLG
ncbi:hypothetical protein N7533_012780 [Penicillium manginii]|uniref:uncharacterized protein n=1 Tax=Penicillium manginii TaxID=203109 RepID=UPI00254756B1|nr:uncharacterized protein N7533_012780 [Penicillium manginii]KAJ5739996.1 hypothetical protein N7533_012780 [Penicillium manginii]